MCALDIHIAGDTGRIIENAEIKTTQQVHIAISSDGMTLSF